MRDETSELIRFENGEQYGKKSARVHRWPGGNHQHRPVSTMDLCRVSAGLDDGVRRTAISLANWRGTVADPADTVTAGLCPIALFFTKASPMAEPWSPLKEPIHLADP